MDWRQLLPFYGRGGLRHFFREVLRAAVLQLLIAAIVVAAAAINAGFYAGWAWVLLIVASALLTVFLASPRFWR